MAEKTPEEIALERIFLAEKEATNWLDLNDLGLSSLPDELWSLTNLEILLISHNHLKKLPSDIKLLTYLKELDLHDNLLTDLPPDIESLSFLKSLDICANNFSKIPSRITKLLNLEELSLGFPLNLQISQTPYKSKADDGASAIKRKELREKLLRGEEVIYTDATSNVTERYYPNDDRRASEKRRELRERLLRGEQVTSYDGSRNHVRLLPKSLKALGKLQYLDLRNNDLPIPPEILERYREPQLILNYYYSITANKDKQGKSKAKQLNEVKTIFVGQGSVGKTSLVLNLLNQPFDFKQIKTDGIAIHHWHILLSDIFEWKSLPEINSWVRLNIWDFGGQEIMHATHQFFLTKRSLYLLVLDSRLTQEENRVEYWLKIIQSFGGESPVLIVGNKIDQHPLDIDRSGLQKKYPNIVGILETSAATGAGIEELKATITKQVNNLPHVRDLLPETWFTVKTELEELGRKSNFITHDKYLELCAENEVSDETSQRTLIGFLHDLGVVLHFQDDPRLEALGILNPQWVTNGVYKILNSHTLFQNKGVLTVAMLDEILNLPEYPRGKRLFIVDMMKKFELCYDIEPDKTFLVPDLLPKDQPDLKFSGIPAFEYAYPVLPSSVITRFIVRMNQKIDDGLVWRTGVLLKIGENKALVKADLEDKKIAIAIDGLEHTRRDALSAIRYQLDEIHASIKGLNPEKFVPVPGAESQRYEFLLQLEHDGVKVLPVPGKSGGKPVMVDVSQLLSGVESEAQRKVSAGNITNNYIQYVGGDVNTDGGDFTGHDKSISAGERGVVVGGNVSGDLVTGEKSQLILDSYNKIASAEIPPELKETLQQLTDAVSVMNQELPEEQAAEAAEDLGKLVDEAVKPRPNKKWYSVSIEGLIKAAENLGKVGEPVIKLAGKILSLLAAG
jgi:internalin A